MRTGVLRSAFALFVLLLAGCGPSRQGSGAGKDSAAPRKGQIILLKDALLDTGGSDTVRFGRLRSGEIAELQLWLKNESTRPVVVLSYERSCGCTSLAFDSEPIAPGDAQRIGITFDSRGERGWQLKTLDIRLAGARKPLRLYIEAEVE